MHQRTSQDGNRTDMRTLTITEVVTETGVPPATVHYYLRLGLLPRPKRVAPNRFTYDERHIQGLRLIRTLRERRGLSLPMIKRILPELLQLEATDAFLPEMWDRALAPRMPARRRLPKARLLDAAKEAFARRGYGEVNVDDLCRAARIAKGSFYRHYRSKEELFLAVAASAADDVAIEFRRAVEGGRATDGEALEALARALESRLPIFLDLISWALQRKPGYAAALRRLLAGLASEVGQEIPGERLPSERGMHALSGAVSVVLERLIAPPLIAAAKGRFDSPGGTVAESHTTRATG